MKSKYNFYIFILIFICALTFFSDSAYAKRIKLDTDSTTPILYDDADVFTDYEEINIISGLSELYKDDKYIYAVITTTDVNGYTIGHELEDIYNDHNNFFEARGTVLFLINTDKNNTFCELQGYNDAAKYIPHEICNYINEELNKYIEKGEYYTAAEKLIDNLKKVRNNEITPESLNDIRQNSISYILKDRLPMILLILLISIAVSSAVIILFIILGRKSGIKSSSPVSINICSRHDIYVRSVINRYNKS